MIELILEKQDILKCGNKNENNDRRGRQASILYGSTVVPGFDTRETYFVLTWCALVLYSVTV
jgi:hypothetical protein